MSGINCGLVKEIERKKTPKDKREKFTLQASLILKKKKKKDRLLISFRRQSLVLKK